MKRILMWGGGGHAKVVADVVRGAGYPIVGVIDGDPAKIDRVVEPGGARVVITQVDFIRRIDEHGSFPDGVDAVALGIGDNRIRFECLRRLGALEAPPFVHPTAIVSPSARIGRGTVVMPGAIINAAARIGDAVIVNTGAIVEHDCEIGDGAHLSPGSTLGGEVRIGERSWIGAGATVIQRITIGADTTVGAGATVIREVVGPATVAGVPAVPIETRRTR